MNSTTTANDFLHYSVYEPTADDMREWDLAMEEQGPEDETVGCDHESVTTANGHGAYCRCCGITLA